ncbi:hypothetical protein Gotur_034826 [Gossypium turneri]
MRLLIELNEQFNKIVNILPSTKRLLTIDEILCIPTCIQLVIFSILNFNLGWSILRMY